MLVALRTQESPAAPRLVQAPGTPGASSGMQRKGTNGKPEAVRALSPCVTASGAGQGEGRPQPARPVAPLQALAAAAPAPRCKGGSCLQLRCLSTNKAPGSRRTGRERPGCALLTEQPVFNIKAKAKTWTM